MTTVTTEQEKILSRGSDLAFLSQPTAQSAGISFALNDDSNSTVSEALAIAEIPSNSPEGDQSEEVEEVENPKAMREGSTAMLGQVDSIHSESQSDLDLKPILNKIVERCNVLCGIRLNRRQGPSPLRRKIWNFSEELVKVGEVDRPYKELHKETTLEELQNYTTDEWVGTALQMEAPFAAAKFDINQNYSITRGVTTIQKLILRREHFPRAIIEIQTEYAEKHLSPRFKDALMEALASEGQQRSKLRKLFHDWGHVIALQVTVGAERKEFFELDQSKTENANSRQNGLSTSMNIAGTGIVAGGAELKMGKSVNKTALHFSGISCFETEHIGGSKQHNRDTPMTEFQKGVDADAPTNWRIILRAEPRPIIDFIPEKDRKRVIRATPGKKSLIGRYLPKEQLITYEYKGYKVYLPFISDEEAEAGWRCLGQSLDPTCALIVREEDDSSQELLVKVEHLNSFRNISKGTIGRVLPWKQYYPSLGGFICPIEQSSPFDPKCKGLLKELRICGVHKDLLAPAMFAHETHKVFKSRFLRRYPVAVWPIGSKVAPEATTAVDVSQITSELDTEIVAPAVESQLTSVEATDASPRNDNVIPTDVSPTQNNEVTPANTSPMQTDEVIPTINLQLFQVFEGEEAPEFFPWGLRKDCVKIEKGFERPVSVSSTATTKKI